MEVFESMLHYIYDAQYFFFTIWLKITKELMNVLIGKVACISKVVVFLDKCCVIQFHEKTSIYKRQQENWQIY